MSQFQNSVSFGKSFRKSGLKSAFSAYLISFGTGSKGSKILANFVKYFIFYAEKQDITN
jgi:hypothetical protein